MVDLVTRRMVRVPVSTIIREPTARWLLINVLVLAVELMVTVIVYTEHVNVIRDGLEATVPHGVVIMFVM